MSRVFAWPDAHGPRILHFARHASSRLHRVLPGSDTICPVSGGAGRNKRFFAQFSLRRSSSMVWQRLECAVIKARLGGDKPPPVHWGCCLGHLLNQRDGMYEFVLKAGIALGIENAA